MERRGLMIFFIFILSISFIQASTLDVDVLTLENHKLDINFLDAEADAPISCYHNYTDTGDGTISFEVTEEPDSYDIYCYLMDGSEKVLYKLFENVSSDQKIQLILIPGAAQIIQNYSGAPTAQSSESQVQIQANETESITTENESLGTNETENTTSSGLGGFAVINETLNLFSNKISYYIGIIIILGLVGFMVLKRVYKRKVLVPKSPKRKDSGRGAVENAEDIEEKIEEDEEEIQELRKKKKIDEMKRKLIEDEKELMDLRKEEKEKKK
jgi:hypothetical protein